MRQLWLIALLPALALAQNEPYWSERWCERVGGEAEVVLEIRDATIGNYALGNERFRKQVEASLQRRATRGRWGRPPKSNDVESGTSL